MEKLDWLPLYIDELLSSPAYLDMTDYQFGWYMRLLVRSTRSERLGYLPLDGQLWRLAGALSQNFFQSEKSRVMACFKVRQFDGQEWIYNPKLLSVMEEQSKKYRKRAPLISPEISDFDFGRSTSTPNLPVSALARGMVETIFLPITPSNMRIVSAAIEAVLINRKCSTAEAHDWLMERVKEAQERGEAITKFWFEDGKYGQERRNAQSSKAQQRQQSNREGISAAVRSRYSEHAGSGGVEGEQGTDRTGHGGLAGGIGKGARAGN